VLFTYQFDNGPIIEVPLHKGESEAVFLPPNVTVTVWRDGEPFAEVEPIECAIATPPAPQPAPTAPIGVILPETK
jgi:hypothetical protein